MRAGVATTLLAGALAAGPAVALASGSHHAPTHAQIARAVGRAERSSRLWATVNICDSRSYPNTIGIRGQMPALGFAATLTMTFQVDYWSSPAGQFLPIPGSTATRTESLGVVSNGLQQDGAKFPFRRHAGRLMATVTFTWTRGGRVIGRTQRATTAGHPDAAYGSPPRYSAATCRIR